MNKGSSKKGTRGPRRGNPQRAVTAALVNQARSGTLAYDNIISDDFTRRRMSSTFTNTPPKSLSNQVFWFRCNAVAEVTTSTSAITETNFAPNLQGLMVSGQYLSLVAIFDQYFIHMVISTITNDSGTATYAGQVLPRVYTAIDYDSVSALGAVSALAAYESVNMTCLQTGGSVTRTFFPCVAHELFGAGSAAQPAGVGREWVDNGFTAVPFYGFRSIIDVTQQGAITVRYSHTAIIAFRCNV